ncbi:MAG: serine/threonine protein kinase [Fuerstiella sp.]|nr:serine/threonine protein kinase [Fuerstiella sp.]
MTGRELLAVTDWTGAVTTSNEVSSDGEGKRITESATGSKITAMPEEMEVTVPPRKDFHSSPDVSRTHTAQPAIPNRFDGYEIIEEIARGGMGVVYRAYQKSLDRVIAIKTVLAGNHASEDIIRLFRTEARAAAKLNHPGIVPVYDVGECHGYHYFSMPVIDGVSLSDRVARGPLDPDEAARLLQVVAETIQFAHEHRVIHRDLKPGNILIDPHDQPLITDFGIARRIDDQQTPDDVDTLMGTAEYMPPEQALGEPTGPLSDVYSLGATLYCLLTGRPPFQSHNTLDTLLAVIQRDPVPPRRLNERIPRDLALICLKCMQKRPEDRYQSARAVAEEFTRFLEGEPVLVHPVGNVGTFVRWMRREPRSAAISAGLVVCFTAALGISVYYNYQLEMQKVVAEEAKETAELAQAGAELSEARARRWKTMAESLLRSSATEESRIVQALQYSTLGEVCLSATRLLRETRVGPATGALETFRTARRKLPKKQQTRLSGLLDQIELSRHRANTDPEATQTAVRQLIEKIRQLWLTATDDSPRTTQLVRSVLYSQTSDLVNTVATADDRSEVNRKLESLQDLIKAELFVVATDEVYLRAINLLVELDAWVWGPPSESLRVCAESLRQSLKTK